MTEPEREPDLLGAPFTAETLDLLDDDEGPVVATLVHRPAHTEAVHGAVLYVHGFNDYFFQTDLAAWWADRGYAFYALDLRKYGRSIREHQTPTYVTDLEAYDEELDAAWQRITERDGHDRVVLVAHSTGGLIVPLWMARREHRAAGLVLNSPWLDMRGPVLLRTVGTRVIDQVGARQPRREIPRNVSGLYARSLHQDHEGEWHFDLAWKPLESQPVRAGWLRAIRRGHAQLHRGLDLDAPTLVLASGATSAPAEMGEDVHGTDIVLDVEQIRRWSPSVARHLTLVSVEGARHDVFLSRSGPRELAYREMEIWLNAYVGEVTPASQ